MSSSPSNPNHSSSGFMGGVLLGSAIGAIAGLLFAPRPGRETRQLIQKSSEALPELVEDLATTLQLQAGRLSEAAIIQWEATLLRLQDAVKAGLEASQEVQHAAASLDGSTDPALRSPVAANSSPSLEDQSSLLERGSTLPPYNN